MAQKKNIRQMSPRRNAQAGLDTFGNLAVAPKQKAQPQYQPEPQRRPAPRPQPRPRPKVKKAPEVQKGIAVVVSPAMKFMMVCGALVFFAVSLLFVTRLSVVSGNNNEIIKLEKELSDVTIKQEALEMQYSSQNSLNQIMAVAEKDMNMGYPESNQVRAVALHVPDKQIDKALAQEEPDNQVASIWSRILELLQ